MIRNAAIPVRSSSRRAFTLIELMVVVAIMAILAGLVFGAMQGMGQNAKRKKAGVQIAALELGLEMFRQEYGDFPISAADPEIDAEEGSSVLYQALSGDGNDRLQLTGTPQPSRGEIGSSHKALMEQLDAKRDPFKMVMQRSESIYYVSDPWGQPYRYVCHQNKSDRQSGQRNPASYDLFTHGQTTEEELANGGVGSDQKQWITNWD